MRENWTPLYALGEPLARPVLTGTLPTGTNPAYRYSFDGLDRLPNQTQGFVVTIRAIGATVYIGRYGDTGADVVAGARHALVAGCSLEMMFVKGTDTRNPLFALACNVGDVGSCAINVDSVRYPWRESQRDEVVCQ